MTKAGLINNKTRKTFKTNEIILKLILKWTGSQSSDFKAALRNLDYSPVENHADTANKNRLEMMMVLCCIMVTI